MNYNRRLSELRDNAFARATKYDSGRCVGTDEVFQLFGQMIVKEVLDAKERGESSMVILRRCGTQQEMVAEVLTNFAEELKIKLGGSV